MIVIVQRHNLNYKLWLFKRQSESFQCRSCHFCRFTKYEIFVHTFAPENYLVLNIDVILLIYIILLPHIRTINILFIYLFFQYRNSHFIKMRLLKFNTIASSIDDTHWTHLHEFRQWLIRLFATTSIWYYFTLIYNLEMQKSFCFSHLDCVFLLIDNNSMLMIIALYIYNPIAKDNKWYYLVMLRCICAYCVSSSNGKHFHFRYIFCIKSYCSEFSLKHIVLKNKWMLRLDLLNSVLGSMLMRTELWNESVNEC